MVSQREGTGETGREGRGVRGRKQGLRLRGRAAAAKKEEKTRGASVARRGEFRVACDMPEWSWEKKHRERERERVSEQGERARESEEEPEGRLQLSAPPRRLARSIGMSVSED